MSRWRPASLDEILCARVRKAAPRHQKASSRSCAGILARRFAAVSRRAAKRTALRTDQGFCTYAELMRLTTSVAAQLWSAKSFGQGDRVILMAPNSVAYVAGFYGILLAGGVVVPVPVDIETSRLESIAEVTDAAYAITTPDSLPMWPEALIGNCHRIEESALSDVNAAPDSASLPADQLAAIFFTSGSSGRPKGVMLSHRNLLSNAESIQQYLKIDESDRALAVLPFPHAFGNSVLQSHLLAGAELALDGSPVFPESILSGLADHQCTSLSAVPELYQMLCERSSLGERDLPHLRYMAVAGGSLPHHVAVSIRERIAPAEFFVMYGQTEATARLAYLPPDMPAARPNCIGQGIPGVELQVVDDQAQQVAAGQVGEIRARGPNIMLGYWRDPDATAEVLRDGWLYTGDLATVDAAGRIYVRGRKNAIVKIAGYRVHPREVEEFVSAHWRLRQAVVVPFETATSGTRLALFLRPAEDASAPPSASEVLHVCRQRLPRHRIPVIVHLVQEFPLTASLKIDRQRLADVARALDAERLRVA